MLPPRPLMILVAIALLLLAVASHAKDDERESLWAAVRNGDPKEVKAQLAKGADANAKNEIGITALWIAASTGKAEIIQQLLKAGADVNARDGGKEIYKERLGGISYTASPVAADGRLYFTTEQGEVRVVKAGPKFELLAVNDVGDVCMATPAISDGTLFVRSQHFLFALGRKQADK